MIMRLKQKTWEDYFKGWLITGCALRTPTITYIMAREDISPEKMVSSWDSDIPTRIIVFASDKINEICGYKELNGFSNPSLSVARKPKQHGLILSAAPSTFVAVTGSGDSDEEYVDKGSFAVKYLKCVFDYTYAIGPKGNVYKRVDLDRWVKMDRGMDYEKASFVLDIDGFDEDDVYIVGKDGDIWNFNGDSWTHCNFPSKESLNAVVCAPDGNVYIGADGGSIWKGRNNNWTKIYDGSFSVNWNEMRWFQDKLWVISDYMLRIVDDGSLVIPQDGQGVDIILEGHMDVYDGVMLIAGLYTVHTFDGKNLYTNVAPYS